MIMWQYNRVEKKIPDLDRYICNLNTFFLLHSIPLHGINGKVYFDIKYNCLQKGRYAIFVSFLSINLLVLNYISIHSTSL